MNKLEIKGNWHILKGELKEKYANLTDNDLLFIKGKEEDLVGRMQRRISKTKREVLDLISGL